MRARNVLLALLIVIVGMSITASRKGVFAGWRHSAGNWLGDLEDLEPLFTAWGLAGTDWQEVHRFSDYKAAGMDTVKSLIVENPNGGVTVTGGTKEGVGYEAIEYRRSRNKGGSAVLELRGGVAVELQRSGRSLHLRVRGPKNFWRDTRVDLTVTARPDLDVTVSTASGSVEIKDMTGRANVGTASGDIEVRGASEADVKAASGSIQLRDIRGPVDAHSASGSITLANVSGEMKVKTTSGSIRGTRLDGALSAKTISGGLTVRDYAGSPATLNTTSGAVEASLSEPLTGDFYAHSVSGSISLAIPPGSDCTVDLRSVSGRIALEHARGQSLEQQFGRVRRTLGAGTGRLEIETVSGSVEVTQAAPAAINEGNAGRTGQPSSRAGAEQPPRPAPGTQPAPDEQPAR